MDGKHVHVLLPVTSRLLNLVHNFKGKLTFEKFYDRLQNQCYPKGDFFYQICPLSHYVRPVDKFKYITHLIPFLPLNNVSNKGLSLGKKRTC